MIDAERIELDSGSVDGVPCQSTYMLVADPAAALAETRRVLRPGGRLALSVWGAPERNPWASIDVDPRARSRARPRLRPVRAREGRGARRLRHVCRLLLRRARRGRRVDPYIAGWGEDGALDAIREYAQTIDDIARRIEDALSDGSDASAEQTEQAA